MNGRRLVACIHLKASGDVPEG